MVKKKTANNDKLRKIKDLQEKSRKTKKPTKKEQTETQVQNLGKAFNVIKTNMATSLNKLDAAHNGLDAKVQQLTDQFNINFSQFDNRIKSLEEKIETILDYLLPEEDDEDGVEEANNKETS